jgi:hypothetical protein
MKARILFLPVLAFAGIGASYALANGGGHHNGRFQGTTTAGSCQRTHLRGTTASPQTFVVTVAKSGDSSVAPGQVVTVSVGGAGQTVAVNVGGCLTGPSALAAREAELHAFSTVTTSTTGTGTTTTGGHGDDGDHHGRHHHGHKPPTGTTTGTTTTTG